MAAYSANPNITPMDVMLAVMRDTHVALEMRVKMALLGYCRAFIENSCW